MPVLLIFAVSIAEFSMAMRLHHKVAAASRYGAKLASEAPRVGAGSLGTLNSAESGFHLKTRIDRWLTSLGLSPALAVQLDHNVCGAAAMNQLSGATSHGSAAAIVLPELPPPDGVAQRGYVRVTVWLPLGANLPNALRTFGLDWNGATLQHSTTFRIETDNHPPQPMIAVDSSALPAGVELVSAYDPASPMQPLVLSTDRRGTFELSWTARGSHDVETTARQLQYRWESDHRASGSATQERFRTQHNLGSAFTVERLQLVLDAEDDCGCSSRLEVPVEIRPSDALQRVLSDARTSADDS
jgi:hypothetical protein